MYSSDLISFTDLTQPNPHIDPTHVQLCVRRVLAYILSAFISAPAISSFKLTVTWRVENCINIH